MKKSARHGQVTTEKLSKLYDKVEKAAEELFDRDEDGDLPVDIQLVDRTRHESIAGLMPVPYLSHAETLEDFNEILRALLHNLGRTTRDIEKLLQLRKLIKEKPLKKDTTFRDSILMVLGGAANASDEQILHNLKAVAEKAKQPPEVKEVIVEKPVKPSIHSVHDLVVGDTVMLFPTTDRPGSLGEVVDIIPAGRQLTDHEIQVWLEPDPIASSKQWVRMRKAVTYDRFVIKREDDSYMLVPRIPEQVKQVLAVLR